MPAIVLITLPLSDESILNNAANRYREARLEALLTYPEAFSSSYEREEAFPMETWITRITNKQAKTFALVKSHNGRNDLEKLLDQPWLGSVTLLGPKVKGAPEMRATEPPWFAFLPPYVPLEGSNDSYPLPTLEFHMVGFFVLPQLRGRGFGKSLGHAAVRAGQEQGKALGADSVKISVLVESNNAVALGLYKAIGFQVQKEEEFADQKSQTKVAYLMEQKLAATT